jgi:hypothetical protein
MRNRIRIDAEMLRSLGWALEMLAIGLLGIVNTWVYLVLAQSASVTQKNLIITVLARFLCERACTEWVGDLYEMRATWREQELSSWMIHIRTLGAALQVLVAQLRCIAYDRVFTRFWEKS